MVLFIVKFNENTIFLSNHNTGPGKSLNFVTQYVALLGFKKFLTDSGIHAWNVALHTSTPQCSSYGTFR